MVDSKKVPNGILLAIGRRRQQKSLSEKSSCSQNSRLSIWSSNHSMAGSSTCSSSREDELDVPNEFVVECKHGERLFVTSYQGEMINTRCSYFHSELLSCSNQVIKKDNWDIGILRHIVELLSTGSTSIPNEETFFTKLLSIADEVGVDIRLTSLINQYDTLNKVSTDRFFPMIDIDYLQFNIRAAVASSQWMALMKKGILLLLQPKMLVVKIAPNENITTLTEKTEMGPKLQRLIACDGLCSEFRVFAKGKLHSLITILDVLSTLSPEQKTIQLRKPESYKLIFKTRCGIESPEQIEFIMRMSTVSYMRSNSVEEQYVKAASMTTQPSNSTNIPPPNESRAIVVAIEQKQKKLKGGGGESNALSIPTGKPDNKNQRSFEFRTLSGPSFLVLKSLFEVLKSPCNDENGGEDNCKKENLPACLIVTNPTPDTLGRFINSAHRASGGDCYCRVGFDLEDNCFFVSSGGSEISQMLDHLADYSSTAVVNHCFNLYERQKDR